MRWPFLFVSSLVITGSVGCDDSYVHVESVAAPQPVEEVPYTAELAPYGTWSEDETYGTVWTPTDADFVPYGNDGHFADLGDLVWISDVPWGAATLHHGHWVRSRDRWRWIPGRAYAGAHVKLFHDGHRTSWAPEPPTHVWRRGKRVRIAQATQPMVVGSRDDDELALVPPNPPPVRLPDEPSPGGDDFAAKANEMSRASSEASSAFADGWSDESIDSSYAPSSGGGHAAASSTQVTAGAVSSHVGGSSHGSPASAAGHR